jgi:formylglycine-generating enzyme required for sulfatase activity
MPKVLSRAWFVVRSAGLVLPAWVVVACQTEGSAPPALAQAHPELVAISGGAMTSGFATGTMRAPRSVSSYSISRHPVTWGEYDACVRSGRCSAADPSECGAKAYAPYAGYTLPDYQAHVEHAPAVCVGQAQADAYCRSIGGRLPTLDQWLFASRGSDPHRYPWGDGMTACDAHPLASQIVQNHRTNDPSAETKCPETSFDGSELEVGKHPTGNAASGLQDVLSAPGELLGGDPQNVFTACGGAFEHCVVFGSEPAAIDSVEPFFQMPGGVERGSTTAPAIAHAYAFRCVLDVQNGAMR